MAKPVFSIDTDQRSRLKLSEQIDVLTMPPAARRRLLKSIGKETRQRTRGNIRHQETVAGAPMPPRAGRKKRRCSAGCQRG